MFCETSFELTVSIACCGSMQDGVNWLAFLARYQLHGILCDDMGLGKTLQALCILASDHYRRTQTSQVWLLLLKYSHRLEVSYRHGVAAVIYSDATLGNVYALHWSND